MFFFVPDFLDFFIELAGNNHKDWFDENRTRYEENVREPFKDFVAHIISEIAKKDESFKDLEPKNCIFRINRDIRFSKDKTPYKLKVSAVVAPGGKKNRAGNGIYFELGPEHLRVYGGIFELDKEDLLDVREAISENPGKFKKLISNPSFGKLFGEVRGDKNKVVPKHLKEAAEKEPLIFNKQWYFYAEFDAETILKDDLDEIILNCYKVGRPIDKFFNDILKR